MTATDAHRRALTTRSAAMGRRHAVGFEAGWVAALVWLDALDCFTAAPASSDAAPRSGRREGE